MCVCTNFPDEPRASLRLRPRLLYVGASPVANSAPRSPYMCRSADALLHIQHQQQTGKTAENTAWRNMFSVLNGLKTPIGVVPHR